MQIAALAVTAVLCAAVIRRGAPEAALVLVLVVREIAALFTLVKTLFQL